MPTHYGHSFFFAYAGKPRLRAEAIRTAVGNCDSRGVVARSWEDLRIEGRLIIDAILEDIDGRDACIAEVSSSNPNVLFEAGYALARRKHLFLAIDETDNEAVKSWSKLEFTDTIGRINYGGNPQKLADKVSELAASDEHPLLDVLLAGALSREENAVFAPGSPHKFHAAERLEQLLNRNTHLQLLAAEDELSLGPLGHYVKLIYRSSAAILHFIKPTRTLAENYNSRLALLAGIVHGFDLPLLMVAEEGYETPLDYKDLLFAYSSTTELTEHVKNWLDNLPTPEGSKRRLGRLKLEIELPIRTFGEYVAESERQELADYFVPTNEFEAVLAGRASVFVGRKGTGKTATMIQSVKELRTDRRILVVPIKPSSYDLSALTSALERFDDSSKREYFLLNLWCYLLLTEVALRAISHAKDLPAGLGADADIAALSERVESLGIDPESDLSTRLDEVIVDSLRHSNHSQTEMMAAADGLRNRWQVSLMGPLRNSIHKYDRVAVLIDNLDKTWERGVDFEKLSRFLLSLLISSGKLRELLAKSKSGQPPVNLTLTAFLRTDIYDVMSTFAREPDKINSMSIQWDDEELLIRVLEDRYVANRSGKKSDPSGLWSELFAPEVHSQPTRDYFLWRALPRPRDLVFLGNAALTTAINRRHDTVLSQDLIHAEGRYSRFAVEALLVESEAQGFDLEELLFEFAGLDSTVPEETLSTILATRPNPDDIRDWLIRTSFLGVETSNSRFVYVEGESEARKKLLAARRLSDRFGRPLHYRVHPAFRPYLEIRDDDVYAPLDAENENAEQPGS
ncbi:hypothetical protein [Dietzia sp. B44]|uniref:P-loop ATPase, Sll1717 family n=1 Tax=Dietzia sp. B44 TaxID=1630633 RepID=UPI0015FC1F4A|nr:hypothetical protein [Dietzia sp. B44]MBB1053347.1 hypothetical protein [Dietzia sp. B44]